MLVTYTYTNAIEGLQMTSIAEQVLTYACSRNYWEANAGIECVDCKVDDNESTFTFADGSTLRFEHDGDDFECYLMDGVLWEEVRVIGGDM